MPSRSPVAFQSCTAVVGDATVAPAQTVAFEMIDGGFVGTLSVPAGTTIPSQGEQMKLFVPGHGPAHLSVVESRADAGAATLRFRVVWMSPDLRAACRAA